MANGYSKSERMVLCRILINTIRAEKGLDMLPPNEELNYTGEMKDGRLRLRLKEEPEGNYEGRYSVWDKKTGEPVMIDGTIKECALAMRICPGSFRTTAWRSKTGKCGKWHIEVSEEEKA